MAAVVVVSALLALTALLGAVTAAVRGGHLDRNHAVGIKTRHTLHCEQCWSTGHRASLPHLQRAVRVGLVAAAVSGGLALALRGQSWGEGVAMVGAGAGYLALIALTLRSAIVADRAARTVHRPAGSES